MSTVSRCKLDRDGGKLRDSVGNWFRRGGEGAGPQTEGRHWPAPPPPPSPRCSLPTPARTVTSLYCCTANQIRYSGDVFVSIVRPVKSIKLLFIRRRWCGRKHGNGIRGRNLPVVIRRNRFTQILWKQRPNCDERETKRKQQKVVDN